MSEKMTEERVYEVGFLLTPQFTESEIPNVIEEIKAVLAKNKAETIATGNPEFIDLAYQMEKVTGAHKGKFRQAYFGWIKFAAEPETLEAIKGALDGFAAFIRYILMKTDKDNTVVFKKPKDSPRRESAEALFEDIDESLDDVEEHEKLPELESDMAAGIPAPVSEAETE